MRVCFCGPLRPGNAITAAPLRDGTYQPSSSSPSPVVNFTSSYATPRLFGGHDGAADVRGDVAEADDDDQQEADVDAREAEQRRGACNATRGGRPSAASATA